MHPIERAAELRTRLVKVHPFVDGNGRTAHPLLNFELPSCACPTFAPTAGFVDRYPAQAPIDWLEKATISMMAERPCGSHSHLPRGTEPF